MRTEWGRDEIRERESALFYTYIPLPVGGAGTRAFTELATNVYIEAALGSISDIISVIRNYQEDEDTLV